MRTNTIKILSKYLIALYFLFASILSYAQSTLGIVVNEDFTDGSFNNVNAGINGKNWKFYGPGTSFANTNNRGYSKALSNRVAANGDGWADGAQWAIWNDLNSNGSWNDNELKEYSIHKDDDVTFVKFRTFSDYIGRNNFAGVEVAFLEHRDALLAAPHYGHDQSWETMACYYASPGKGGSPNQLETNVENTDNPNPDCVKYANKNGWLNAADLENTFSNLVIWRNMRAQKKCNIEQWGDAKSGDFMLDTSMVALLNPNLDYSHFNFIQLTFFRGQSTAPNILRSGVAFANAQIGITHSEIGITKKSDFNLDYYTDIEDFFALAKGWGTTGKTMLDGDATNDGNTDNADYNIMANFWGVGVPDQEPNITRYAYDQKRYITDARLKAQINVLTGEIKLIGSNVALIGYQLKSKNGGFISGAANNIWKTLYQSNPLYKTSANEISDLSLTGSTITSTSLANAYNTTADTKDIQLLWQSATGASTYIGEVEYVSVNTPGDGLKADYYHTRDLTGAIIVSRVDATVNFGWGNGSFETGKNTDNFSARWTGQIKPQYSELYTFETETDDGVRLWVNGTLLVDKWVNQSPTKWTGTINLTANQKYDIKMEYFENGGGAVARLSWSSASQALEVIPQSRLYSNITPVAVSGVSVSPASDTLTTGVGTQLTATVAPANATNKTVSWTSSNNSVATVSSTGMVNAIAEGNAIITATTQDGSFIATTAITVNAPVAGSVVYAVNAGGGAFTALDGTVYEADRYFTGGSAYTTGTTTIANTTDDLLYRSERYGNISYEFPVTNGDYTVTLKFAEIYHNGTGKRQFDVAIEGVQSVSNLDIFASAGANYTAYDVIRDVTVTDGKLNIAFTTDIDNAKISAILVQNSSQLKKANVATDDLIINNSGDLNIYPNPTSGKVTINYANQSQNTIIRVFNLSGKQLLRITQNGKNIENIDLSRFGNGVYIIKIDSNSTSVTRQIIVE